MRPEWARWLISQGADEEHLLEANMIFAVRPSNIQLIPKFISLLRGMHVIVALPARETPTQYAKCGEWSHKKKIVQNEQTHAEASAMGSRPVCI